jgi:hypothetical protein
MEGMIGVFFILLQNYVDFCFLHSGTSLCLHLNPGARDLSGGDNRRFMNTYLDREEVMEKTEELFDRCSPEMFLDLEKELMKLGYIQRGSDPASAEFHHPEAGLMLDVEFDEEGEIHSYELLKTEEMEEKQREFRW